MTTIVHEFPRHPLYFVDSGSLYRARQHLLQRRWIAAQWKKTPNGRRAKYYHRLTPLGRRPIAC